MWTVIVVVFVYAGLAVVFFLLGQISIQKKIERKTGVVYRNYTQSNLIALINIWKCAWDDQQEEEQRQREKFMTAGAGLDPETADAEMGIFDEDNIEDRRSDEKTN